MNLPNLPKWAWIMITIVVVLILMVLLKVNINVGSHGASVTQDLVHQKEACVNITMKPKKSHKQIFIVDDDASVCCALGLLLVTYGFAVDTFNSAKEFFHAVPNSLPGCLILDIHMPVLDGWEALKRIIKSGSKRSVIIISADKSNVNYERAMEAGAAGYLQKPFNDRELVDFINGALENEKQKKVKKSRFIQFTFV